ncbi:HprK-related kinase A [Thioalkalivibrio sp. AKL12]|uniref:HprK-related kinase A n=1 Tax=Thioalkalivibrio sp. AKL12 TaxID=1158159 RepID=UPI000379BE95|nr:HprK-related kinase A [Thioalkalivibrio sp. AKL12]
MTGQETLKAGLRGAGLPIQVGPFVVRLRSRLDRIERAVALFYDRQLLPADGTPFADFHITLARSSGLHAVWRPQARFFLDGRSPFRPLPLAHAYPLFEWGLNWCIAQHAHDFLMIHAAVLERDGQALVMPGEPGAGKSTLTAALALSGWRLLSDEFALLSLETGRLVALPRPVSLKNAAIDLIRERYPQAIIGPSSYDTSKGTVAHLKPPGPSIERMDEQARPAWLVFPRFAVGGRDHLEPLAPAEALQRLVGSSFNYSVVGAAGFEAAADLIEQSACLNLEYADLDATLGLLNGLPEGGA